MARPYYERLSTQDSSFLMFENGSTPMHVAAVSIFEFEPLANEEGGLDRERLLKYVESHLTAIPLPGGEQA